MRIKIEYLADHISVIPELASFHLDHFGQYNPEMTWESRQEQLLSRSRRDSIPLTLVALDQDIPIGSVSLIDHDLPDRPEWTPWVASVIVRPDYRRRGIGTALMEHMEREAARVGYNKLYLFTPDKEVFYSTVGWKMIGREMVQKNEVVIMEKQVGVDLPMGFLR